MFFLVDDLPLGMIITTLARIGEKIFFFRLLPFFMLFDFQALKIFLYGSFKNDPSSVSRAPYLQKIFSIWELI
ncbi:MAG: hypothetical protein CM15mP87_09580 [Candidatus Neomarinimicrobiota bacterium]|nr:MAG: hypothetical protein CM15mP87_09580 [Candidatus Neomarinimicrobiota bacterium]